jgi:hypothetical protein
MRQKKMARIPIAKPVSSLAEYARANRKKYPAGEIRGGETFAPPFPASQLSSGLHVDASRHPRMKRVSGAMNGQQGKDAAGKGKGKRRQGSGRS